MLLYMETEMKICSDCKFLKPLDDFGNNARQPDGKHYYCRACTTKKSREWAIRNPDKVNKHKLKYRYGITPEELEELMDKAGHKCQLCGRKDKLNIDHCHENGHVRGILCGSCNRALGILGDSVESIERVLAYLGTDNAI